jgi:alpha-methylacyl-CoA racemase
MGPLAGTRIVEFAGIGPGPFAAMMLADMGADILRIERPGKPDPNAACNILLRGRRVVTLDLKSEEGKKTALRLVQAADALIEGFRPGVMERLGLGPDACFAANPALVYGRMTGWGQSGPLSQAAGHDLNYIAITGALWATGEAGQNPVPALNLLGDGGGGGMLLAYGIVCGLLRAGKTGKGDVVDAAISDGTAALMAFIYGYMARNMWENRRGANFLDGSAPYYGVYRCADKKWIAVGAIEPQFFEELIARLDLPKEWQQRRHDKDNWPELRSLLEEIFCRRTRDEWSKVFEGTDACIAPVLDLEEAADHPHNRARGTYVKVNGLLQPAPAPKFRDAEPQFPNPVSDEGGSQTDVLANWGLSNREAAALGLV